MVVRAGVVAMCLSVEEDVREELGGRLWLWLVVGYDRC